MDRATVLRGHSKILERVIEIPAVIVVFIMMFHIAANALLRYFFRSPIPNTLEITQYWYLPIVALLGFVAAQNRAQHIATDLLFSKFPRPAQRVTLAVAYALCALTCAGFAWFGLGEALHAMDIRKPAGISTVPAWPVYFLVPVAFATMTVQLALASVGAWLGVHPDDVVVDTDDIGLMNEVEELTHREASPSTTGSTTPKSSGTGGVR
ncbi:MAG: TRAP transporter small permease [Actinomycetales bacterium]